MRKNNTIALKKSTIGMHTNKKNINLTIEIIEDIEQLLENKYGYSTSAKLVA